MGLMVLFYLRLQIYKLVLKNFDIFRLITIEPRFKLYSYITISHSA
jgi:hypothetical protein